MDVIETPEERFKRFLPDAELYEVPCGRRKPMYVVKWNGYVYSDSPIRMSSTPEAAWKSALRKVKLS